MNAGGVGAGGRFGETEGANDFAGSESFKVTGPLRVAAIGKERELNGRVRDRESRGHGGVDASDFFEHEDVGERVETGTAPFFRHEHAAAAESAEFLDGVEGKVVGALPVFDVSADFGLHELADSVADEKLVVGEGEVHGREDGSTRIGHGGTESTERSEWRFVTGNWWEENPRSQTWEESHNRFLAGATAAAEPSQRRNGSPFPKGKDLSCRAKSIAKREVVSPIKPLRPTNILAIVGKLTGRN